MAENASFISPRTGLSRVELAQIRHLAQVCNQADGLLLKLNWSQLQDRPSDTANDFLYYESNRLVGYLGLYLFNNKEAEASAMIHPDHRRRGIFKQLYVAARQSLLVRNIPEILFICDHKSEAGGQCLAAIGSRYDFSEYKMTLAQAIGPTEMPHLKLRPAGTEDIATIAHLDQICFNVDAQAAAVYLQNEGFNGRQRHWLITAGSETIGKIQVSLGAEENYIFGFCILPQYRGRGYGRTILKQTVWQLVNERSRQISLEVACHNASALKLYEQCGFQVVTTYDYYRAAVTK